MLQVVTDTQRRGAQVVAVELDEALRSQGGTEVRTVALTNVASPEPLLPLQGLGPSRLSLATLRALREAASGRDLVIAHGSTTLPAARIALLGRPTPILYRSIGDPAYWVSTPAKTARIRVLLKGMHLIVALWEGAAAHLRGLGVPAERIMVIPQWVDPEAFRPATGEERRAARASVGIPEGERVVGLVGALSPEKDLPLAIDAAALTDAHLLVVGDGPLRSSLRALSEERLPSRTHFVGSVPRPASLMAAVDLLLLTSQTEGMPAVALEAAAMEIPVVAAAVGSLPELCRDGVVVELVHSRTPEAFAAASERVLAIGAEARLKARAAVVSGYSIDALLPRWEDAMSLAMSSLEPTA